MYFMSAFNVSVLKYNSCSFSEAPAWVHMKRISCLCIGTKQLLIDCA